MRVKFDDTRGGGRCPVSWSYISRICAIRVVEEGVSVELEGLERLLKTTRRLPKRNDWKYPVRRIELRDRRGPGRRKKGMLKEKADGK
jgi:hypothetical protein